MPIPKLVPLARIVCSLESERLPLTLRGGCPSLLRVLEDSRTDDRRFIVYEQFGPEGFLQCVRQAHQDVFGMVEVSTLMEYTVHRMKAHCMKHGRRTGLFYASVYVKASLTSVIFGPC